MLIMIQVKNQMQSIILDKEKEHFYSNKQKEHPSLFKNPKFPESIEEEQSADKVLDSEDATELDSEQPKSAKANLPSTPKSEFSEEELREILEQPVSKFQFLKDLQEIEKSSKMDLKEVIMFDKITNEWKEKSSKFKQTCKFDFKFEAEKYRVGSHSFRYTYNKNEMTWNTALKCLFNNAKKLIVLQERIQSFQIFRGL